MLCVFRESCRKVLKNSLCRQNSSLHKISYMVNMSTEPSNKKFRNGDSVIVKKIGTHNGVFHCDEVLGCFMLKLLYPDAEIIRSRDDSVLNTCDIVIDVGSVYDPELRRFDHHQRGFNESMSTVLKDKKWKTKLSSAGLVYCHYGLDIISAVLKNKTVNETVASEIFDKVYEDFIQEIDGIDNGIPMYEGEPKYRITTNLSARVNYLNRQWNQREYNETDHFEKAMKLVGGEFSDLVVYVNDVWWPARDIVKSSILNRFNIHPSGEIIELKHFVPWKGHFFDLEQKLGVDNVIKFVVFTDVNGFWRVQAVSVDVGSFVLRLPLYEEWRGLRDEELSKLCGIDECIFVHHSGFIGGTKTRDGALSLAIKTLELTKNKTV